MKTKEKREREAEAKKVIEKIAEENWQWVKKNPWVLLNGGIPVKWFTEDEVNVTLSELKKIVADGEDLSHISLRNMITEKEIHF